MNHAVRRDRVRRPQVDEIYPEIEPHGLIQADAEPGFCSGEAAVALHEVDYRQPAPLLARCERENEVAEIVVEEVDLAIDSFGLLPQGQVDAIAALGAEAGIAHLEDQRADVRRRL